MRCLAVEPPLSPHGALYGQVRFEPRSLGFNFGHAEWDTTVVTSIHPGSQADRAHCQPMWVVAAFNGRKISHFAELVAAIKQQLSPFDITFRLPSGVPVDHSMWPAWESCAAPFATFSAAPRRL